MLRYKNIDELLGLICLFFLRQSIKKHVKDVKSFTIYVDVSFLFTPFLVENPCSMQLPVTHFNRVLKCQPSLPPLFIFRDFDWASFIFLFRKHGTIDKLLDNCLAQTLDGDDKLPEVYVFSRVWEVTRCLQFGVWVLYHSMLLHGVICVYIR